MKKIKKYQWINKDDGTCISSEGVNLTEAFLKLSKMDKGIATTGLTYITINGVAI